MRLRDQIYAGIATQRLGVTNYCSLSSSPESRRCVYTYCAIVAVSVSSVLRWPGPGSESACCCPIPGSRLSGNKDGLLAQISSHAHIRQDTQHTRPLAFRFGTLLSQDPRTYSGPAHFQILAFSFFNSWLSLIFNALNLKQEHLLCRSV